MDELDNEVYGDDDHGDAWKDCRMRKFDHGRNTMKLKGPKTTSHNQMIMRNPRMTRQMSTQFKDRQRARSRSRNRIAELQTTKKGKESVNRTDSTLKRPSADSANKTDCSHFRRKRGHCTRKQCRATSQWRPRKRKKRTTVKLSP
jgi:hypothetical protein